MGGSQTAHALKERDNTSIFSDTLHFVVNFYSLGLKGRHISAQGKRSAALGNFIPLNNKP
jgi:hypothetical protein